MYSLDTKVNSIFGNEGIVMVAGGESFSTASLRDSNSDSAVDLNNFDRVETMRCDQYDIL